MEKMEVIRTSLLQTFCFKKMCDLVSPNGLHILEVLICEMETKCISHTAFFPKPISKQQ